MDARNWDHPSHPLVQVVRGHSLRPCLRQGASRRARVGRVRSPAFLSILGYFGIGTIMEDSNGGLCMNQVFPQPPRMTRLIVMIVAVLFMNILLGLPGAVAESDQKADAIPAEDYALYDQVVSRKFLTSATRLVVIERMTRLRLSPDEEGPTTIEAFQEQGYFDGELPPGLIREFSAVNRQPSRLEGRFHFGVAYRFATGDTIEEPEASLSPYGWRLAPFFFSPVPVRGAAGQAPSQTSEPVPWAGARPVQAPPVLDRLAFSRVARSLRNDHALVYVEALRPDDTGAGFLVWFRRQGRSWTLFDTEVVWTIQPQVEPDGGLLLAP